MASVTDRISDSMQMGIEVMKDSGIDRHEIDAALQELHRSRGDLDVLHNLFEEDGDAIKLDGRPAIAFGRMAGV